MFRILSTIEAIVSILSIGILILPFKFPKFSVISKKLFLAGFIISAAYNLFAISMYTKVVLSFTSATAYVVDTSNDPRHIFTPGAFFAEVLVYIAAHACPGGHLCQLPAWPLIILTAIMNTLLFAYIFFLPLWIINRFLQKLQQKTNPIEQAKYTGLLIWRTSLAIWLLCDLVALYFSGAELGMFILFPIHVIIDLCIVIPLMYCILILLPSFILNRVSRRDHRIVSTKFSVSLVALCAVISTALLIEFGIYYFYKYI